MSSLVTVLICLAAISVALLVAAEVSDGATHAVLRILLPVVALLSVCCVLQLRYQGPEEDQQSQRNDDALTNPEEQTSNSQSFKRNAVRKGINLQPPSLLSIMLVFSPSISLSIILFLRLIVDEDHFQGSAPSLDFGPKDGIPHGEDNIAFTGEFNTYGHCFQGILASFTAFPAVSNFLMSRFSTCCRGGGEGCSKSFEKFLSVFSSVMTLYPSYSLVKRWYKRSETFATSSFGNNTTEWAVGFVVGWSAGLFITALQETNGLVAGFTGRGGRSDERIEPAASTWTRLVFVLQMSFGCFLIFTTFCAAVLFGITWNNCLDNDQDCVNYSPDGPAVSIIFGFVAVPVIVIGLVIVTLYKRSQDTE